MSDAKQAWHEAWVGAWADMPAIPKDKKVSVQMKGGGSFSYNYADLGSIIDAVKPILTRHGFAVAQTVGGDHQHVTVTTVVYHTAGHSEAFGPVVVGSSADPKAVGSAITYARRYGLTAALGIATEDDDDGTRATAQREVEKQAELTLHELAWHRAKELFPPETQADEFKTALESAGMVPGKDKIRSKKQLEAVVAAMDAVAPPVEED